MIKKKKSNQEISLLTIFKRAGDWIFVWQTEDIHLIMLNLGLAAISGVTLGSTFSAVGAGKIFEKVILDNRNADIAAFISGFFLMVIVQWIIGTMVQIAEKLKGTKGEKQAKVFSLIISIFVMVIALTGVYHLYDHVQSKAIMLFLTMFLVVGELCIIFLSVLRVSIKTYTQANNYILKQVEKEDKDLFFAATQNKDLVIEEKQSVSFGSYSVPQQPRQPQPTNLPNLENYTL